MAKVSVFIPCYNSEKFIGQTLDGFLKQTFSDFEIVIVDDGSTDESVNIISEYAKKDSRIQLFKNDKNRGVVYTRNRGLSLCRGMYVALCDADDVPFPDRLSTSVKYLDDNKDVELVFGNTTPISEEENFFEKFKNYTVDESDFELEKNHFSLKFYMIYGNEVCNSAVMYRRDFVRKNEIKYRDYFCSQDYGFFCDFLSKGGRMVKLKRVLTAYRSVGGGITGKSFKNIEERNRIQDDIHLRYIISLGIGLRQPYLNLYLLRSRAPGDPCKTSTENLMLLRTLFTISRHADTGISFMKKLAISFKFYKSKCAKPAIWKMYSAKKNSGK